MLNSSHTELEDCWMLLRPFLPLFGVDSVRLAEPYDGLADFCGDLETDSAAAPYVGFDDGAPWL